MPHRGRLNLLVGLLGCPAEVVFHKLGGLRELPEEDGRGTADVLSHLSHTGTIPIGSSGEGKTISLLPNPSHLEAINPVQQGVVYALQNLRGQDALAIQIHGDAAFSGQGVVQETLQMSQLKGYGVKGTIHIIVNNQLGFTATAETSRSARYASAPAKMIDAPIIHVNGDSPEDVARAASIALHYQQRFHKDVVLDLVCYRRHGHNELDEPTFTQPLMYKQVTGRSTLPGSYSTRLVHNNVMSEEECNEIRAQCFARLAQALQNSSHHTPKVRSLSFDG